MHRETEQIEIQPNPVFVVGCPRSGTSVLGRSLGLHPETWISAESNFLTYFLAEAKKIHEICTSRGKFHWLSREGVDETEFLRRLCLGVNSLYTSRSRGMRWIDHTPDYLLIALDLARAFPGAKFVHLVRNGRDVVNSMINSGFPSKWSGDFSVACETWNRFISAGLELEAALPQRVIRVHHELMVNKPEARMRRVCAFLDLEYDPAMIDYYASKKVINSSFQGDDAEEKSWRKAWPPEQKDHFNKICARSMFVLGYVDENSALPLMGKKARIAAMSLEKAARPEEPQGETSPRVRFGIGFYPDEGGWRWMDRMAVIDLALPQGADTAKYFIKLGCAKGEYYDVFPFTTELRSQGRVMGRVPFDQDCETKALVLELSSREPRVRIEFSTPAHFTPGKVSGNSDNRELSLSFGIEAVEVLDGGEKKRIEGPDLAELWRAPDKGQNRNALWLDRMKDEWNTRARMDSNYYIYSAKRDMGEEEFDASGKISVDKHVAQDLRLIAGDRDPKGLEMLEIGCGSGRMTRHLAGIFGKVFGVDVSGEMVAKARERLADLDNVEVRENSGRDLSMFADQSLDFVFSFIVFQHIPVKEFIFAYIREAHRVLRSGGIFKFQVMGTEDKDPENREKSTWIGACVSEEEVRRLSARLGFAVLSATGQGSQYAWYTLKKQRALEPGWSLEENTRRALDLSGRHKGETIFMIGASPELNTLTPGQIETLCSRTTVALNRVFYVIPRATYFMSAYLTETLLAQRHFPPETVFVHHRRNYEAPLARNILTVRRRLFEEGGADLPFSFTQPEPSVFSMRNAALAAIHFAAILGAKRLVFVGFSQKNALHFYNEREDVLEVLKDDLQDVYLNYHYPKDHPTDSLKYQLEILEPISMLENKEYSQYGNNTGMIMTFFNIMKNHDLEIYTTARNSAIFDAGAEFISLDDALKL